MDKLKLILRFISPSHLASIAQSNLTAAPLRPLDRKRAGQCKRAERRERSLRTKSKRCLQSIPRDRRAALSLARERAGVRVAAQRSSRTRTCENSEAVCHCERSDAIYFMLSHSPFHASPRLLRS